MSFSSLKLTILQLYSTYFRFNKFLLTKSQLVGWTIRKKAHQAIWSAGEVVAAVLLACVGPCPGTQNCSISQHIWCYLGRVAFHPMRIAKETMDGSCCVLSNEQSKRDDGWLMSNSIPWAKQKRLWVAYVKFHPMSKAKRQWAAHVTLHPMRKATETMGGSCRVPYNEHSKREDEWLVSSSIQWANQKRRWVAY